MKLTHTLLTTVLLSASGQLLATEPREDYDLDDNGLIEINSLQELNAMREYRNSESEFNLSSALGCPDTGCTGFELTTDLDFDTNGDGVIDANDEYWNEGAGWAPIGDTEFGTFGTTFDGNNHIIRNLYINRPESEEPVGLFGKLYWGNSHIRNLAVAGSLTSVTGNTDVGILIGRVIRGDVTNVSSSGTVHGVSNVGGLVGSIKLEANDKRTISSCYSTADVSASDSVAGGLIGYNNANDVSACFALGNVTADTKAGGLIGEIVNMSITNTYASGDVSATDIAGGLIGSQSSGNLNRSYAMGNVSASDSAGVAGGLIGQANDSSVSHSHWTTETGQQYLFGSGTLIGTSTGNSSYSRAVLSCPVAADDTDCTTDATLYQTWGEDTYTMEDETVVAYWNFGTSSQMPVLTAHGYVLRDSDGDGIWDFNDTYPDDPSNTEPKSSDDTDTDDNTSKSSGGGSLAWLLGMMSLMLLRRKFSQK